MDEIKLKPCPFCGCEMAIDAVPKGLQTTPPRLFRPLHRLHDGQSHQRRRTAAVAGAVRTQPEKTHQREEIMKTVILVILAIIGYSAGSAAAVYILAQAYIGSKNNNA